uniref:Uncharacterized protein n=1 Tax=Glossina palpalis gambiensis TaxID=67801 RepID=A0A1B0BY54_9MUSC
MLTEGGEPRRLPPIGDHDLRRIGGSGGKRGLPPAPIVRRPPKSVEECGGPCSGELGRPLSIVWRGVTRPRPMLSSISREDGPGDRRRICGDNGELNSLIIRNLVGLLTKYYNRITNVEVKSAYSKSVICKILTATANAMYGDLNQHDNSFYLYLPRYNLKLQTFFSSI